MSHRVKSADVLKSVLLGAAGVVLYIPAAIGMGIRELMRDRKEDDAAWRFVLPGIEYDNAHLAPSVKRGGLWSQMRLSDYFSMIPGSAAVVHNRCVFERQLAAC